MSLSSLKANKIGKDLAYNMRHFYNSKAGPKGSSYDPFDETHSSVEVICGEFALLRKQGARNYQCYKNIVASSKLSACERTKAAKHLVARLTCQPDEW